MKKYQMGVDNNVGVLKCIKTRSTVKFQFHFRFRIAHFSVNGTKNHVTGPNHATKVLRLAG